MTTDSTIKIQLLTRSNHPHHFITNYPGYVLPRKLFDEHPDLNEALLHWRSIQHRHINFAAMLCGIVDGYANGALRYRIA